MNTNSKIKDLLDYNSTVRELKNFIDLHIKVDDIPEAFIKKHFKNEQLITDIQRAIETEHGHHVYACKIVTHLAKYAAKVIKEKNTPSEEDIPCEKEEVLDTSLPGLDYYDNRRDPDGFYQGKLGVYNEIDLEN